ncbi:MAG: UDP-3-O-(3-hydroxymyristoyl)glucosamine N-acyltransferase [Alphaproteobacteria bacterium]|nr:UDP-3-O-(3-hydroxymyristoyl)glucosamine N-acyltransferase [Alphaproteobacteria bacterium]MBU1526948.1 UDP-3-O-(3-hydroxymyristoyl)glucosamine N-acyltransferase [Alphaproteobacteria bacterium]MBU2118485.1 UDP-3-O-(3-hydroxymyristoyl)glucosamine N-acyltransferase [Alphaproteobacteria bacterium]MBU2350965.1 UDP-3-O-(3-hydroxymyristoyl)glucosamine N-acyltransferase [Alphaproteobacteria bacterium]MBU2383845.1 UDP-3-O-(3-hydroxymyristoyl)glucosamine N-acyltransferase [Alphaproteobacteria bacterium
MPDPRFFESLPPRSVQELADLVGGEVLRGGDRMMSGVAPLASADGGSIAFLSDRKLKTALAQTRAGAVFVRPDAVEDAPVDAAVVVTRTPHAAWSRAAEALIRPRAFRVVDPETAAEDGAVDFGPGVVVGEGARIGRGTRIGPNTVIGPGVQIGRDCVIGANVSLVFALIGDQVKLSSGVRIGEAGFGAAVSADGPVDVPQLGRAVLQDRVTIGANSCVDRGAFDDTVVGEGTKIDNLVMIAHNCVVGRNCLMAAFTGISGSVTVGDGAVFGGRAGVGDHITIGEGARIAAGAGILKDVPPGETWSGYPAKPLRESLREAVWLAKQASGKARGKTDG